MRLVASEADPVTFQTAMSTTFWSTSTQMSTCAQTTGQRLSAYAEATATSARGITNSTAARSYRPACAVRSWRTASSRRRGHVSQQRRGAGEARLPREAPDVLGGLRAEARTEAGVGGQFADGGGERVRVTGRHHPSAISVRDELGRPAHPGHDHGKPARHRLHDGEGHAFVVARQHEHVAGGQPAGDLVRWYCAHETHDAP